MKLFHHLLVASIISTALGACSSDTKENTVKTKPISVEDAILAEMDAIDKLLGEKGQIASSLRYSKEDGTSIQVAAHLSDENELLKIEENYTEKNGGNFGTTTFYMKGKHPFVCKERFQDYTSNPAKFVERLTFYTEKGEVEKTIEKRVDHEDDLANVPYAAIEKANPNLKRAKEVLDQKGPYELTFQGFVDADDVGYLVVGEPAADGFSSALRISQIDPFITELRRDPKKHLNRKVQVVFDVVSDVTGFEFQMYESGGFVK
jgi:hypothetical protein